MSKPEITAQIGGFSFEWPEGVTIVASRLHVHSSDGRVTGEIVIKNHASTLYPQTQLNFSVDRTRNALARTLKERYDNFDWQQIIDQLCYHVQDKARAGEPVVELWTHDSIEPPSYIVEPIIMANQANVLFGPPESGKTQFAMLLCLVAMLPWHNNHLNLTAPAEPLHVLWLDYEADASTARFNFARIVHGGGSGDLPLLYRRCRLPLADDVEAIAGHVEQTGAQLVVIDSLAKAAAGDLDKSESANRFFGALDQLKCTSLILAHTSKGESEGGRKSIYGSVFFEAYARSVWEMRSSQNGDEMTVGLWDNKANFRRKHDPMAFQFYYESEKIIVTTQDIRTVDDFMSHLSTASRIIDALKHGSKSPKELKELMPDVGEATLYAELARMANRGKLIKFGSGKEVEYGLPAKQSDLI